MKIKQQSIELCYAIEAAGASEALTKCSVLVSELNTEAKRLGELAYKMKRFAAENYPPNEAGQVDFVRVVLEGYAQEMVEPEPSIASQTRSSGATPIETDINGALIQENMRLRASLEEVTVQLEHVEILRAKDAGPIPATLTPGTIAEARKTLAKTCRPAGIEWDFRCEVCPACADAFRLSPPNAASEPRLKAVGSDGLFEGPAKDSRK